MTNAEERERIADALDLQRIAGLIREQDLDRPALRATVYASGIQFDMGSETTAWLDIQTIERAAAALLREPVQPLKPEAQAEIEALYALRGMSMAAETVGPLAAQVMEAIAIIEGGSDYERAHVAAILRNGLRAEHLNRAGLSLSFPLRPDFIATVEIPRDMTSVEAERLVAFVTTLAED